MEGTRRNSEETVGTTNENSLIPLIRDLRDETTMLVRQEVALAKAEMSEKISRLSRNAVSFAIGGVMALGAFGLLLLAIRDLVTVGLLNAGLAESVALWLSPLIVAVVVGLMGVALISKAKKAISHEGLAPEKTIESLREDKDWAKHRFQKEQHETKI